MTSRYVDEICTDHAKEQCELAYGDICDTGQPHFWHHAVSIQDSDISHREYDRLMLPVANNDGKICHIIGLYVYSLGLPHIEATKFEKPLISIKSTI